MIHPFARNYHPSRREMLRGASGLALVSAFGLPPAVAATGRSVDLTEAFREPPSQAAPDCYWYWLSENISKSGITHDLEAMHAVGIGGAYIGIIQDRAPTGKVPILSDPFWEAMVHAVDEGSRIGVDVSMFNSPGWSQSGGPWITPDNAMRYIASSELAVRGPAQVTATIPAPGQHFQPVATYAVPTPRDDASFVRPVRVRAVPPLSQPARLFDPADGSGCVIDPSLVGTVGLNEGRAFGEPSTPGTGEQIIEFETAHPQSVRSLSIQPLPVIFRAMVVFEAEVGGKWRPIERFLFDRHSDWLTTGSMTWSPVTISFERVTSQRFRLRFSMIGGGAGAGLKSIRLSPAARVGYAVEKQLGKMHQDPSPAWDSYMYPASVEPEHSDLVINPDEIIDLSRRIDANGVLRWSAPAGDWMVIRSGMLPTGVRNGPAPPLATGLDVDKMNSKALAVHFDAYVGEMLRRLGSDKARRRLHQVIADSYETGPQNWTDGFEVTFRDRYGYDPRPWLPTLTGRVIGSADRTDRFLWDLRRLVADTIANEYVGALRRISAKHGLGLWLENYGHWGFPSEFLEYGGRSDRVGGEFWVDGDFSGELDAAVSAAALYGKKVVSSEAFTAFANNRNAWRKTPAKLKRRGDWAFARGINHLVLHVYIHQAYDDRKPGINAWFGTEFNRHNTWFAKAKPWLDYVRRSSFLLQQGTLVAELGYYIGENTPIMTGPLEPAPPAGFKFIHVNRDAILNLVSVRNGRFVLPGGNSFTMLVLPPRGAMTPEVAERLSFLACAGGTILGRLPDRSPSLAGYPQADGQVAKAMDRLRASGHWYEATDMQQALAAARCRPSIRDPQTGLDWSHRRLTDGDIFFLSNQSDGPLPLTLDLDAAGHATMLDTVRGLSAALPAENHDGYLRCSIQLPVDGSVFIQVRLVAQRPSGRPMLIDGCPSLPLLSGAGSGLTETRTIALNAPWRVSTEPDETCNLSFTLVDLHSLDRHPDSSVRQFAGSLRYETMVDLDAVDHCGTAMLSLGDVSAIAEIEVNGIACGAAWAQPWMIEIGHAIKTGRNRLNIRVTIGWHNRLVAAQSPGTVVGCGPKPWLAIPIETDGTLEPAGLLGPVTIRMLHC